MAIGIKDSIEPAFARHETFTIRYGWLKRGFDHALVDPRLFYREDAHHVLGVGKNMAKSIRFWLSATRLMVEVPDENTGRRTVMRPTMLGIALLSGATTTNATDYERAAANLASQDIQGFDPYLERLESWWLIHWMMLSPNGKLPVWWTAFNTFSPVVFTVDSLTDHVMAQIEATAAWSSPSPPSASSVKKDVLALLRAYAGTAGSRKADKTDDAVDAPMVPLTLIREVGSQYRFAIGLKPGLSPAIVAFASLDFLAVTGTTARTALISTLATEVGGPGRAFKLSEREVAELIERAALDYPDLISLRSTGSSPVLVIESAMSMRAVASELLRRFYQRDDGAASSVTSSPEVSARVVPEREDVSDDSSDPSTGAVRAISQTRLF